jgi:thiol-disulfide isomerase/thioredoxin
MKDFDDRRRRGLLALALGAALTAALAPRKGGAAAGAEVPIGGLLPEARLRGLNGPSRNLSEYHGRPLIINVWASWCGPCMSEMASLERLAWLDEKMAFSMIGISTDDDEQAAREVLQRSRATLRHYIDERLQMENLLGARTIPLTVLVDAAGRVVDKVHGTREWDAPESLARIARVFRLSRIPGAQDRRERR